MSLYGSAAVPKKREKENNSVEKNDNALRVTKMNAKKRNQAGIRLIHQDSRKKVKQKNA